MITKKIKTEFVGVKEDFNKSEVVEAIGDIYPSVVCDRCGSGMIFVKENCSVKEYKCPNCGKNFSQM